MKATLSNYKQAPRKVRLVARAIVGKSVAEAQTELRFMVKRAASPLEKLLDSALANAVNQGLNGDNLMVKEFRVDKGIVAHRSMPRAFGRASRINKRSSHVTILLAEKVAKVKKGTKAVKAEVKKAEPKAKKAVKAKAKAK